MTVLTKSINSLGGRSATAVLVLILGFAGVAAQQNPPAASRSYESLVAKRPEAATPATPRPLLVPVGSGAFAVYHGDVFVTEGAASGWQRRGSVGGEAIAATAVGDEWRCLLRNASVVGSRDGGRTWAVVVTLNSAAGGAAIVCGGFAPDGSVWASANGGKPTVIAAVGSEVRVVDGPRSRVGAGWRSADALVTASTSGEIYRGAADGTDLERVAALQGATLNDVAFADDRRGWIATGEGNVLETNDGGTSWLPRPVAGATALDAVGLANAVFWVVGRSGDDGVLYVSLDGGVRWRSVLTGAAPLSRPVQISTAAWLVDGSGGVWTASSVDGTWRRTGSLGARSPRPTKSKPA